MLFFASFAEQGVQPFHFRPVNLDGSRVSGSARALGTRLLRPILQTTEGMELDSKVRSVVIGIGGLFAAGLVSRIVSWRPLPKAGFAAAVCVVVCLVLWQVLPRSSNAR